MKKYVSKLLTVVAALACLAISAAHADGEKSGVVTVIRVQGSVDGAEGVGRADYSLDGGTTWQSAVVGQSFPAGTLLRTGKNSLLDVMIGQSYAEKSVVLLKDTWHQNPARNVVPELEHNMIRLRPNTVLGVDKLLVPGNDPTAISDAELNLKQGTILGSVRKVKPSSEYFIKLPTGVAAVRGTQFELSTGGEGTSCSVVSGTVWISFSLTDKSGNPVLGPGGQPFPPIQVSLSPGQSIDLSAALINTLSQQVNQAAPTATSPGTTSTSITPATLQALVTQIITAATGTIVPLTSTELAELAPVLNTLSSVTITITKNGVPNPEPTPVVTTPPDNGNPPHVSTQ
jgi:hypothetical protein